MLRIELERVLDRDGSAPARKANNLNRLAFLAACNGQPSEAVRAAEKCLAIYRQVPDRREETLATYIMMLAYLLADARRFREAVAYGEEGLSMFIQILGGRSEFVEDRSKDLECMRRAVVRCYLDK